MDRLLRLLVGLMGVAIFTGCMGALHLAHYTENFMSCISYPKTLSVEECAVGYIDSVPLQAELPAYWETVMDYEITAEDPYWVLAQSEDLRSVECTWGQCRDAVALVRDYVDDVPVVRVLLYFREVRTTDGVIFIYDPEGNIEVQVPDLIDMSVRQMLEDNAPQAPSPIALQIYR